MPAPLPLRSLPILLTLLITVAFPPPTLALALALAPAAAAAPAAATPTAAWQVLDGCTFLADRYHDGDSFHARHQGREFVFRLHGVDAPETDLALADRIQEQRQAFRGISEENILRLGVSAREHLAATLRAAPFRVVTRWQNALGRGTTPRYYALVFIGRTHLNLATDLVARGLARVHGVRAPWPDTAGGARLDQELRAAAERARREQRGAWSPTHRAGASLPTRLDLNRASATELARLPRIGNTLARRIVEARPFQSFDEVRRVKGVGPSVIEVLREETVIRTPRTPRTPHPAP